MIGLAIDLQSVLPGSIASLCLGSHSFAESVVSHSAVLPATNLLMFLSGFAVLGMGEPPAPAFSGDRRASVCGLASPSAATSPCSPECSSANGSVRSWRPVSAFPGIWQP